MPDHTSPVSRRFRASWAIWALIGIGLMSGCVDTRPSKAQCVRAPRDVLADVTSGLSVPGGLRHGTLEARDGLTFVSAELVRDGDPERLRGKLLTWVTGSLDSGEYFAVDVYARDSSTWPDAPFDVRQPGAIDSRACTAFRAGEPDPATVRVDDRDVPDPATPDSEPDPDGEDPGPVIGF